MNKDNINAILCGFGFGFLVFVVFGFFFFSVFYGEISFFFSMFYAEISLKR